MTEGEERFLTRIQRASARRFGQEHTYVRMYVHMYVRTYVRTYVCLGVTRAAREQVRELEREVGLREARLREQLEESQARRAWRISLSSLSLSLS